MRIVQYFSIALAVVLTACSNRGVYQSVKAGNRMACLHMPPAQQADCLEWQSQSYEDYQREREALAK